MVITTNKIVSVTEANQNFSKVAKQASKHGDVVLFKRNKPAYVLFDVEKMGEDFIKEYEQLKLKYLSEDLIKEYGEAHKKLAE